MTRFLRRALCAAAGVLALAGATQAGAATFEPLQSPSFGPIPDARVSQETASVALLGDVDLGVGSKVDLVTAPVDPAHANGGDFAGVGTSLSRNLRLSAGLQSVTAGASTFTPDVASALAHLAAEP